jgi:predicted ester cyclase
MSETSTRRVMNRYWESAYSDLSALSEDVVFTLMPTGDTVRGPEAVRGMLDLMYHVAFDAHARVRNTFVCGDQAVWEGHFVGTHIGEFVGVAATGREVCVPMCIVYDLEGDEIRKARIYFETAVLLDQLGGDS